MADSLHILEFNLKINIKNASFFKEAFFYVKNSMIRKILSLEGYFASNKIPSLYDRISKFAMKFFCVEKYGYT